MKNIYLLLSLLFVAHGHSQDELNTQTLVQSSNQLYTFDRSDKSIQGTPYMDKVFEPARVSSEITKIFYVRYNLVNDEMEVKNENEEVHAINKSILNITVTFLKNNKTYQVFNYLEEDDSSSNGYFILLSNINAKSKLLLKESKVFKEGQAAKSGYEQAVRPSFKKAKDKYFIKVGDDYAMELPKNKKDVAKLFPKFESQILSFIKKNKIKTSSKEDLLELTEFIDYLVI